MGEALRKLAGLIGDLSAASDADLAAAVAREFEADPTLGKDCLRELAVAKALNTPIMDAWLGPGPGYRGLIAVPGPGGLTKAVPAGAVTKVNDMTTIESTEETVGEMLVRKSVKTSKRAQKLAKAQQRQKKLSKRYANATGVERGVIGQKLAKIGAKVQQLQKKAAR